MLKRIGRIFRSIINAILGRAESGMTIAQMDTALRDMQTNVFKYKEAVAMAIAHEKRSERRYKEEKARFEKLTEQARVAARQAVEGGTDSERKAGERLAKRALQLRGEVEGHLDAYKTTWQNAKGAAEVARQKFDVAAAEIEKRARQLNEARTLNQLNESRRELQGLTEKFDIESATAAFDSGLERIHGDAEQLEAMDRLALSEGDQLDRELEKLTARSQVQGEYERLFAEVGGTAPAAKEKAKPKVEKEARANRDPALE